ncbi:MAG TPA: LamG domain-containing protein, partial [Phycisphaerae bacterium]|nr:LamG domain-containing protein [Phycisphaerae bacterium]HRY70834.1 LamG domain-containing protein [Phycisphaerae bacterium]HSA30070.1 LamG domain-containing protein [Phycisphaerae bacterium]
LRSSSGRTARGRGFSNALNSWTGASWNEMAFPFVQDRWYHIAYVYDAGTLRCYVDGIQIGSVAHTLGGSMGQTFQIGASAAGGNAENFIGGIDEVAIYSDALTGAQLLKHFNTLKPRFAPPAAMTSLLASYEAAILAEPSLLSYYTFEGDTTAVSDKKGPYNGTLVDLTEWTEGFAGGQALGLQTYGHVGLGNVEDFKFSDGTGSIEAWVNPTGVGLGLGNKSIFAGRDDSLNRYTMHVNTSNGDMGVSTTGNTGGTYLETPAGTITGDAWQHVVAVFSNDGTTNRTSLYINGVAIVNNVAQILGTLDASSFQIGAGRPNGGFRFLGQIDELAVYSEPLTPEQVAAHFNTTALTFSIAEHDFVLPSQAGPIAVTLSLPLGTVAPVGGTAVTLAFDASIVEVSAGGVPVIPDGQVVVPAGQNSIELAVKALGLGGTNLVASAPEALFGCTAVFRVRLGDQGIIIVDDHFDDNPSGIPSLDASALAANDKGPGGGWSPYSSGKSQRERGTNWEVLSDGGDWSLAALNGLNEDEFKFMTDQGVRLEWVISNVTVTADNPTPYAQHPTGETSDVRHEFGIVSAIRPNGGSNELYTNTSGGLYVNVYYSAVGAPPTQNVTVTGSVRVVNNTHTGGDEESLTGLETVATFTLTGIASITPSNPLSVTIEADEDGWEIGFSPNANPTYVISPQSPGVTTVPVAKLAGGWDANSLNDAEITSEFVNGAFAYAHFQNMGIGRGSSWVDRARVCIGCKLTTDCPDPFADADRDGDVDQLDFGIMQLCFTGENGGTPQGCRCFDRDEDGSITAIDFGAFQNCATSSGPMIPADAACDDD